MAETNPDLKFYSKEYDRLNFLIGNIVPPTETLTFSVPVYSRERIEVASIDYGPVADVAYAFAKNRGFDSIRLFAESSRQVSFIPTVILTEFLFEATK